MHYVQCPVCKHNQLNSFLYVKDWSVSGEDFELVQCGQCSLVLTQDAPDMDAIAPYYQFDDYISHTDSKKGIINQLYHQVRKFTLKKKCRLLQKTNSGKTGTVLDIGSGTGAFLHAMQEQNWQVTGVETDELARNKAKELYGLATFDNSHLFSLPNKSFDIITLWHVLEHVHALETYLQTIKRLLKEHGKLILAVPNYTSTDAGNYKNYWAAYDVPRHLYHFSPNAIQAVASQFGFKLETIKPMWFDSFYVSMLSEKYKKGNLILAMLQGLRSNFNALRNHRKCSSIIYILSIA